MKPRDLRRLIIDSLPDVAQAESDMPSLGKLYLPPGHQKALSLDRPIVLGGRGAGKTFWLSCLRNDEKRSLIASNFGVRDLNNLEVRTGFDPSAVNSVDARLLKMLLSKHPSPSDIWYSILVVAVLPDLKYGSDALSDRVEWVMNNPETVSSLLMRENSERIQRNTPLLVAFDGLDRLASSWDETVSLLRGLLQAVLEFLKYSHIRTKLFLRNDLFLDSRVRSFPDASKLVSLAVSLDWTPVDLYGLFFQYLANSNDEKASLDFRSFVERDLGITWKKATASVFPIPDALRLNESKQSKLFHHIAGAYMGSGPKRGDTWRWLPSHLKDAEDYVSPRSFLVALHSAGIGSESREFTGREYALHWRSIQDGVRTASKKRVEELAENFPWIQQTIVPLSGLGLPARKQDIISRWKKEGTLANIISDARSGRSQVPLPSSIREGDATSLISALEGLGICRVLRDKRVDFPDIVRVEAGMTRKGGVPLKER